MSTIAIFAFNAVIITLGSLTIIESKSQSVSPFPLVDTQRPMPVTFLLDELDKLANSIVEAAFRNMTFELPWWYVLWHFWPITALVVASIIVLVIVLIRRRLRSKDSGQITSGESVDHNMG